MMPMMI